jgi:ethanolamine kinase
VGTWHQLTDLVCEKRVLCQSSKEYEQKGTNLTTTLQSAMWPMLRKWLGALPVPYTVPNTNKQHMNQELNVSALARELAEMEAALNRPTQYPIVFCHNDLLGLNIIYDNSSERLCFIDYEYANFNHRAFDIANHFCEYAGFELDYTLFPTLDVQRRFAKAYLTAAQRTTPSSAAIDALLVEVAHFIPVSHLQWALWSFVQATVSTIDFDYLSYGFSRLKYYYLTKNYIHRTTPINEFTEK